MSDVVALNVSGKIFMSTWSTICMSHYINMISPQYCEEHGITRVEDADKRPFIDRDPELFSHVLEFMRTNTLPAPVLRDFDLRERLYREAKFFDIPPLLPLLEVGFNMDRLAPEDHLIQEDERRLRRMFAEERAAPELQDSFVGLVDVYDTLPSFTTAPRSRLGLDSQMMFHQQQREEVGTSSLAARTLQEFETNLNRFTHGVLEGLDWSNLFLAGGSVLAALTNTIAEDSRDGPTGYRNGDLDLFIYGLSPEEACERAESLAAHLLRKQSPTREDRSLAAVRTAHCITFATGAWGDQPDGSARKVQLILRLFKSPAEVLSSFDIDCVRVGFDGRRVYATPSARRALNHRVNVVDPSCRRSQRYEHRLHKYAARGFMVAVPGLERALLKPELLDSHARAVTPSNAGGLATLLALERAGTWEDVPRRVEDYSSLRATIDKAQIAKTCPAGPRGPTGQVLAMHDGTSANPPAAAAPPAPYMPLIPSAPARDIDKYLMDLFDDIFASEDAPLGFVWDILRTVPAGTRLLRQVDSALPERIPSFSGEQCRLYINRLDIEVDLASAFLEEGSGVHPLGISVPSHTRVEQLGDYFQGVYAYDTCPSDIRAFDIRSREPDRL